MQPLDQHLTTPENITKIPQNSTKNKSRQHFGRLANPINIILEFRYPFIRTEIRNWDDKKNISSTGTGMENPSSDICRKGEGEWKLHNHRETHGGQAINLAYGRNAFLQNQCTHKPSPTFQKIPTFTLLHPLRTVQSILSSPPTRVFHPYFGPPHATSLNYSIPTYCVLVHKHIHLLSYFSFQKQVDLWRNCYLLRLCDYVLLALSSLLSSSLLSSLSPPLLFPPPLFLSLPLFLSKCLDYGWKITDESL